MDKLRILYWTLVGECIKALVRLRVLRPVTGLNCQPRDKQVVVTLTTYGRRVGEVWITLVSLLRQTMRPDHVVVWLDSDKWNDDNLPSSLRRMVRLGVEVRYCDGDLRSYKKLVPTLEAYPDSLYITVDDDMYYSRRLVERLVNARQANEGCVCVNITHAPRVASDGALMPYKRWHLNTRKDEGLALFGTGGSGAIYDASLLHEDVTRRDLFKSLCPLADDVWFYFMEVLAGTKVKNVGTGWSDCIPIDNVYQLTHRGNRLADSNCGESMNDRQIRAVMEHYALTVKDLMV